MISRLSREELKKIAFCQKMVIVFIVLGFLALLYPPAQLIIGVLQIVFVYKLAKATDALAPWLYVIACFIPLIVLIALFKLSSNATNILRENGVKVGVLGAKEI
ncbi:MAG: hypothetical protein ACIAQZ_07690 [Sedimentisphaeraceae bacterium JB056]